MPFEDLTRMSLPDYVEDQGRRGGLWIFQHIPKTAGTSLTDELDRHAGPYYNIYVDYRDNDKPFEERLTNSVDRFLDALKSTEYRSCSGHLTFDLVARIQAARPDARVVTFLRNPVDRVISDYRYQCSDLHPGNEEFRAHFPRIEDYIEAPGAGDKMAMMIWGSYDFPAPEALIAHLGQRFHFVGLLEMYALSFGAMFEAMGLPGLQPQSHSRKTPDTAETKVAVTAELRDRIAAANRMDQLIYDHVHAVLSARRDGWWARGG